MCDDIYEKIVYDGVEFQTLASIEPSLKNRCLTLNGVSKSYCMTGFRLGYVVASKEFTKAMAKLQSHVCGNVPVFIQKGALAALENESDIVNHMKNVFSRRMNLAYERCKRIFPGTEKPEGAFYLFPKIDQKILKQFGGDKELAMHILKEAKVAILPGSFFGEEGYLRICFATSDELIEKGFNAIETALKDYL